MLTKLKSLWSEFLAVAAIVLSLSVLFFVGTKRHQTVKDEIIQKANEVQILGVRALEVSAIERTVPLVLPSFLVAYNVTPVLSRINGYLVEFYADIGDLVKAGQLLCLISTPDVDAEWEQAKAVLASQIARQEIAQITADRWVRLYAVNPEATPKEQVDRYVADLNSANADVDAAKAHLENLTVLKDFKYIYAPFDGVVTERNIDIGSLITVGNQNLTQPYIHGNETLTQPLFQIANIATLRAFVTVPQPYYPYIQDGVSACVSVPEHPEITFSGIIDRNASSLDPISRTLLTQVNIDNSGNKLLPGLYTEVRFEFKPKEPAFMIPADAMIIRDGNMCVAIVDKNEIVRIQKIKIGNDYGKTLEIIEGLQTGDKVVLAPTYKIQEGVKVVLLIKQ